MRSVLRPLAMAIVVLVASNAPAQDRRPPTIDDLLNLVQVSGAEISPDGKHLIYTKLELKKWSDNKRVTSYGGILGGRTITQTNRFRAASLGAMVSDWSSEYAMGVDDLSYVVSAVGDVARGVALCPTIECPPLQLQNCRRVVVAHVCFSSC
jgi:hypothetical protein